MFELNSLDEESKVLIKGKEEKEKQFKQQLELITGSFETVTVLPITPGDEIVLKVFYVAKNKQRKMTIRFIVENMGNEQLTNEVVNKLIVENVINNRLSSIFSQQVKFTFFELCLAKDTNVTTGKRPLFGITGQMTEDDSSLFFRMLFNVNDSSKSQTMHIKGVPDELSLWEEMGNEADCIRAFLMKFTSTFKERLIYEKFMMHCTGIGPLRKSERKKLKAKTDGENEKVGVEKVLIQRSTVETKVVNVLPVGFKTNIRQT